MAERKRASTFERLRKSDQYWTTAAVIEFTRDLARLMRERRVSKSELAARIGTVPSYVTKVLSGDANFTLATMNKLARALGYVVHVRLAPEGAVVRFEYDMPSDAAPARSRKARGAKG